ncbi:Hsp33 family molecular chaperone HslO [Hathewaya limosa]|uniref:33 kDa chaperonin n=1 Tax=Hathewaya limosa TaxID=1536 RepID=A0ABU0JUL6_HATLI|nr:Hsp33 family molecular chaperone HslO [Hathewaya limosa]AWZ49146.1 Hsp33 family molecular chaperone HslO [Clostridiaceae bacterium 14S0207]MDQ0479607.1 molecular chaperone Hsp33 [Hathewaya limosa]
MSDKLVRGTAHNGDIRVIGAITTELVNEAVKIHGTTPTASAALGRLLTAGSLMGAMLKSDKDKLTLKIDGGGEAMGVVVNSYADASVKGYIGNPLVDLSPNAKGKLDVGGAIGKEGELLVIRDMGLKEPYVGRVPIYTGEIGDDIAYYYTVSEQVPSAVAVGVLVDKDLTIKAAGGFIIQMMPGADDMLADILTYRLEEIAPITTLIASGKGIDEILQYIFEDMDLKLLQSTTPKYNCDCSRERVERALISIGKDELSKIAEDNKTEEIRCQFCGKKYSFTPEDVNKILKEI